jgi:hypothetical protein
VDSAVSAVEPVVAIDTAEAIATVQDIGAVGATEDAALVKDVSADAVATVWEAVEPVGERSNGGALGARYTIVSDSETTSASVVVVILKLQQC